MIRAFVLTLFLSSIVCCESAWVRTKRSWKDLRDQQIVKQTFDYSCGTSSVATILRYFYGVKVTEKTLLEKMNRKEAASFFDLAKVSNALQFRALGLAMDMHDIKRLKIPVIVYLLYKGQDHFSVIRGVGQELVWLADGSWGNTKLSMRRFKEMFYTRKKEGERLKKPGKVLLILPQTNKQKQAINKAFFKKPSKRGTLVYELLLRSQNRFNLGHYF